MGLLPLEIVFQPFCKAISDPSITLQEGQDRSPWELTLMLSAWTYLFLQMGWVSH